MGSEMCIRDRHHGVITEDQFKASMVRMADVVDKQNGSDPEYTKMLKSGIAQGTAYEAAWLLVVNGVYEPAGYTEPRLHASRKRSKKKRGR